MNIIIVGAGIVGQNLAKRLADLKHDVTIIDLDEQLCEKMVNELNGTVINGDATNIDILEEAGLSSADFVVTVTGTDETNLLICLMAKEHRDEIRLASRISNDIYKKIFLKSDIELLISPEMSGVDMLEELIVEPDLPSFVSNREGKFEIVETSVGKHSKARGKTVGELEDKFKYFKIIAMKEDEFSLVNDETVLEFAKPLIVAVNRKQTAKFKRLMK